MKQCSDFSLRALYQALEAQRQARGLSWAQVAREVDIGVASLTDLSRGGRTGFPQAMMIFRWLGHPAAQFTHAVDR